MKCKNISIHNADSTQTLHKLVYLKLSVSVCQVEFVVNINKKQRREMRVREKKGSRDPSVNIMIMNITILTVDLS